MATGQKNSFGPRRRHKGKTVLPNGYPRSQYTGNIGGGKAPGYECGQDRPYTTKELPGRFRVAMPIGRWKFGTEAQSIGADERL